MSSFDFSPDAEGDAPSKSAMADKPHVDAPPWWTAWHTGLTLLTLGAAFIYTWAIWLGQRSEYYAAIAVSMSQSWSNFFFGSADPAGTVTLDKIPGSFWIPAFFIKMFGFSTAAVDIPNGLATVAAVIITAIAIKRLSTPLAGLIAGAVVATTPVLAAVARSNQPESFFLLGMSLVLLAGSKAMVSGSRWQLILAGMWVALAFQMYMLEAWAVWPALIIGYLFTAKPFLTKIWDLLLAGMISLGLSLAWITIVWMVPTSSRPYIGGTYSNNPFEMVFGYNGLGRFTATQSTGTADASYRSFTPPFGGSAGAFRLFNEQVAGQVAWLIPAAVTALVILILLKANRALVTFFGAWLVVFYVMFSAVAGMHQFYTAVMAFPIAGLVGLAIGAAFEQRNRWAAAALVGVSAVSAIGIGLYYTSYWGWVPYVQFIIAAIAISVIVMMLKQEVTPRWWMGVLTGIALTLTPAVWAVGTIAQPSSINPMAGPSTGMGGMGAPGGQGGLAGGLATNQRGQNGAQGMPNGQFTGGQLPQRGAQGQVGPQQNGQLGGNTGLPGGAAGQGGPGGPSGMNSVDTAVVSFLKEHRGTAKYFLATFGAMSAAPYITATGEAVLPIGGFDGSDPVPTLDAFKQMVTSGQLRYVLAGSQGGVGPNGNQQGQGSLSRSIQAWVTANCATISVGSTTLYDCQASK